MALEREKVAQLTQVELHASKLPRTPAEFTNAAHVTGGGQCHGRRGGANSPSPRPPPTASSPRNIAAQVLDADREACLVAKVGVRGHLWRQDHVLHLPQRAVGLQRLGIGHVEAPRAAARPSHRGRARSRPWPSGTSRGKARQPIQEPIAPSVFFNSSAPSSEQTCPPSNAATTRRRSTHENSSCSGLHCVHRNPPVGEL